MPSDLAIVREWVGSEPCDNDARSAVSIHGTAERAALAILRARRADMVAAAARWAVADDYSQDTTANIKALVESIARLERLTGEDDDALPVVPSVGLSGPSIGR